MPLPTLGFRIRTLQLKPRIKAKPKVRNPRMKKPRMKATMSMAAKNPRVTLTR